MSIHHYPLFRALACSLGCLSFLLSAVLVSAQGPPIGQWDCVLSGHERGVAHLFFNTDGTLSGRAVFTYLGKTTGVFTNRGVVYTNIFGAAYLDGNWSYASPTTTNRIVGFINLLSSQAGSTEFITNALSFSGTARASKLTLLGRGYPGQVTFVGIPLQSTNDLRGTYYGTGQKQGAPGPFTEVFNLTAAPELDVFTNSVSTPATCFTTNITFTLDSYSITNFNSIIMVTNFVNFITITQQVCFVTNTTVATFTNSYPANYYSVEGSGPAYQYTGRLLVSRQKYAAFYQGQGPNDQLITVYAGPFNPATGRGLLVGTDGVIRNIKYSIYHGPVPGVP
jgi:hypothetical protein